MDGIGFPTPVSQIPKVEKPNSLAINVYGHTMSKKIEKVTIFHTTYLNNQKKMEIINLLLISEDVEVVNEDMDDSDDEEVIDENYDPDAEEPQKETKYHYCWIKNLNRLLYDQNKTQM